MSKEFGGETLESMAANQQQQQIQIQVDDSEAPSTYCTLVRVGGSAEEVVLDFAGPLKPTGPKTAVMQVENRIFMNPFAAKRLQMALKQAIDRYEEAYGELELDERKRRVGAAAAAQAPKAEGKLS